MDPLPLFRVGAFRCATGPRHRNTTVLHPVRLFGETGTEWSVPLLIRVVANHFRVYCISLEFYSRIVCVSPYLFRVSSLGDLDDLDHCFA